jgi:hypothetical protein
LAHVETPVDVSLLCVGNVELNLLTIHSELRVPIAIGASDACIFAYPQVLFVSHLHLSNLIHVTFAQYTSQLLESFGHIHV